MDITHQKTESINSMQIAQGVLSDMSASHGSGIYLSWVVFARLAASIVPYMLRYVLTVDMALSVLFSVSLYSCCTCHG